MEIQIRNVSKSYSSQMVINNMNFTFSGPGLYIIFGRSGSGKTTLLNLLAGLEVADNGTIIFNNNQKSIGVIFQHHYLFGNLTALENVQLPLEISQAKVEQKIIADYFKAFGVENIMNRKIKTCSGGESQRVNIIRTIVNCTEIILADEPTGSVDSTSAQVIKGGLIELSKEKLVLIVTHDKHLFSHLPASYLYLDRGNLFAYDLET